MSRSHLTARVLFVLGVAFVGFDASIKLLELTPALESTRQLGIPEGAVFGLGAVEFASLCLYLWPRTAPLGALLLTGYLGGAVATHLRLGSPWLSHTLFPVYLGLLIWLPLALTDARVRGMLRSFFVRGRAEPAPDAEFRRSAVPAVDLP